MNLRGSQSGGYLLSHNIPQCSTIGDAGCVGASIRLSRPPRAAGAHSPHRPPPQTPRASEADLTTPELRLDRPTT